MLLLVCSSYFIQEVYPTSNRYIKKIYCLWVRLLSPCLEGQRAYGAAANNSAKRQQPGQPARIIRPSRGDPLRSPARLAYGKNCQGEREHLQARWSGVETRLRAALQDMQQHASAQGFLRRLGIPRAGACRPERVADPQQEPAASSEESEAMLVAQEPL